MLCSLFRSARPGFLNTKVHVFAQFRTMSSQLPKSYIVTPKELQTALAKQAQDASPRIVPIYSAWFMPNDPAKRTGATAFEKVRIPGSRFFNLDTIKHPDSPYPHMLPTPDVFATAMRELGIRSQDTLVCYDSEEEGLFSAPRVAWTITQLAHPGDVHVLDNFKLWVEAGLPTESGPLSEKPTASDYAAPAEKDVALKSVDYELVRAWAKRQIDGPREDVEPVLIDARPANRFDGSTAEPRPGMPSGHVPGAVSVPFNVLLDPETKTLLPKEKLLDIFKKAGVAKDRPVISSCGTGVTAAVLDLALMRAGWSQEDRKLYDGSWVEWAQRATKEEGLIATGKS